MKISTEGAHALLQATNHRQALDRCAGYCTHAIVCRQGCETCKAKHSYVGENVKSFVIVAGFNGPALMIISCCLPVGQFRSLSFEECKSS